MRRFKTQSTLTRAALTLLVVMLTAATAWAYDIPDTGSCGPNATYTINDSTMTISGTGEISNNAFYYKDFSGIKSIVINEGITDIGNFAFFVNMSQDLTSVHLPASLINISEYAFYQSAALTTVNIAPNSQLQTIGEAVFGNTALTSIDLSGCHDLTSIGSYAFNESPLGGAIDLSGCTSLTSIGRQAFYKTTITSLSLPASLISIGDLAFEYCTDLSTVTIADGSQLTTIGEYAFQNCHFESIVMPCAGLTRIGEYAFNRKRDLQNLTEIICLTEESLSVDRQFYDNYDQVTVYMYASKKVAWQDAKAVKGLFTITPDESIADINGTIYGDYYAEGSVITVSTNQTAYGFEVNGVAVDAVSLGNNQYQLTLPDNITTDNVTLSVTLVYSITVPNFVHGSVTSDMATASEGTTVTLTATPDNGCVLESLTVMNGNTPVETTPGANGTYTFVMPAGDVTVNAIFTSLLGEGDGSEGNPYIISSAEGWDYFCDCLQDNDTWNRFSGKTVKLGADISVTRMAGADYHDFLGTFDGGGSKLTFTAEASDSYLAPFSNVLGSSDTDHAVIRNLKVETNITANDCRHMAGLIAKVWGYVDVINCDVTVNINSTKGDNNTDLYPAGIASQVVSSAQLAVSGCTVSGTISTNGKYAGGIIGIAQGSASITNSISSVTIDSSTEGDGTHGGLVAVQANNSGITLDIEGCVFNGRLLGASTNSCGGFVGWRNKTVNISNSLFAPAEVTIDDSDCYTFSRRGGASINNCYYTEELGEAQGKQARSITGGQGVTVGFSDTAAEYGTSGITAYGTGIMYDGVLYAGNEDQVSLNLDGSTTGYTASAGTLTGEDNPFTLIMPDEDVAISAAAPLYQVGDVNHDGLVNISDVTALINYLLNGASAAPAEADVNQDNNINISDVTALINRLLGGY